MNLNQYATMRGMQTAHEMTNQPILDHMLNDADNGPKIREEVLTKRIQFDTTPGLYAKLESVCSLLKCSKREFLEMAVFESIEKAQAIFGDAFHQVSGQTLDQAFPVKE
jgi:hypothetical protein